MILKEKVESKICDCCNKSSSFFIKKFDFDLCENCATQILLDLKKEKKFKKEIIKFI